MINACKTILAGNIQAIDLATCNGYPMLLLAGIGLEANAISAASREAKNRFGILAYIMAGIRQIQELELFEVKIETEQTVITCQATAVTVANAAPPTSILAQGPDGSDLHRWTARHYHLCPSKQYECIISFLSSPPIRHPKPRHPAGWYWLFTASKVRITTNPPQKVVIDGEVSMLTRSRCVAFPWGWISALPRVIPEDPNERFEWTTKFSSSHPLKLRDWFPDCSQF